MSLDRREPGALEHADVLGDGRQRHVEPAGELADGMIAGGEPGEDFAPGRIGEGGERDVESLHAMVNHLVYYAMNRATRQ